MPRHTSAIRRKAANRPDGRLDRMHDKDRRRARLARKASARASVSTVQNPTRWTNA